MLLVLPVLLGLAAAGPSYGAAVADCQELIVDGGFEAGGGSWSQASAGGYPLISDFNPRTGTLGAYLAGVDNADDRLAQPVALPTEAISITLRLWWSMVTEESAGEFDTLTVSLLRQDGTVLAELAVLDNTASVNLWQELELDLGALAGQTAELTMAARTDNSNPTAFFLDDLSLLACAVSPGPTATPTATWTPTATPTSTAVPIQRRQYLPWIAAR